MNMALNFQIVHHFDWIIYAFSASNGDFFFKRLCNIVFIIIENYHAINYLK